MSLRCVAVYSALVIPAGFEPTTHSLEGCCSIQLSYETDTFTIAALHSTIAMRLQNYNIYSNFPNVVTARRLKISKNVLF